MAMKSHCYNIFYDTSQTTMGRERYCFIGVSTLAYGIMALVSIAVSHILVTIYDIDPLERERSGNCNISTVSLTHPIYLVYMWIPRRRMVTECV